jgi:hypothetical protein
VLNNTRREIYSQMGFSLLFSPLLSSPLLSEDDPQRDGATMGIITFCFEMDMTSCDYLTLEERYILRCGFSSPLLSEDDIVASSGATMALLLHLQTLRLSTITARPLC